MSHLLHEGPVNQSDVFKVQEVVVGQLQHVEDCVSRLSIQLAKVQVELLKDREATLDELVKLGAQSLRLDGNLAQDFSDESEVEL